MRRYASPARESATLPILSTSAGPGLPGATSNRTSRVTRYVPLPVRFPPLSRTSQVPPPVTSSESPTTKVPEPVRVILDISSASADERPPASTVGGVRLVKWIMSHRILVSSWSPLAIEKVNRGKSRTVIPRNQRRLAFIVLSFFLLTGISDFNFILARNHMPAALWCQRQIALPARCVANALVGQFR